MFDDARIAIYCVSAILSGISGTAYNLRFTVGATPPKPFSVWGCVAITLNSGLAGLMITMFLMSSFTEHPERLIAISIGFGLGGTAMVDFGVGLMQSAAGAFFKEASRRFPSGNGNGE